MILGLKRQISRFLQSIKLKHAEKSNFQEIQRCPEDGISSCLVEENTPSNGRVLPFRPDFMKHISLKLINFLRSITSNSQVNQAILTDIYEQAEDYGKNQAIKINWYFNGGSYVDIPMNENVVVELSNQAIANPFHVSHLRNIMIGRFITNISKLFNKNVTFVNYLEDWEEMIDDLVYKSHKHPKEDDLFHLVDLVDVFKEIPELNYGRFKLSTQGITFRNRDKKALEIWQKCRDIYVNDHEKMYQRLGIKFDVTTADSQYTEQANKIISMAKERNLLRVNEKTGALSINISEDGVKTPWYIDFWNDNYKIYYPRVIAALFDRFDTYFADRIIYVTGSNAHSFCYLQSIAKKLRPNQPGRIEIAMTDCMLLHGINSPSMRKMLDELMNSKTAIMLKHKLWEDNESLCDVTDKLSICQFAMKNLVVMKNGYTSSENVNESFGNHEYAALQHSHVRLCRLIKLYDDNYSFQSIDFSLLSEKRATRLIEHLARYHEVLIRSYVELQSNHLVHYLINLMRLERLAYEELLLFNQPKEIRDARLTLFMCTRQVLVNGMNILGIQPLGKI